VSIRPRVNGWPCVSGYAGTAATHMLSRILVLFRDQRTRANDYTRVTMVMKRCSFYAIRCAHPDCFFLHRQEYMYAHKDTDNGWHDLTVSPFHTCPPASHGWWSPTSRARHPRLPTAASKNGPSQPRERTPQQHRPHFICVHCGPHSRDQRRKPAFSRMLLTNEYRRLENRSEFKCFIQSSNFRTSFNIPRKNNCSTFLCAPLGTV